MRRLFHSLRSPSLLPSHVFLFSYTLMALAIQAASFIHQYLWSWLHPTPSKRPDAIKLGVLAGLGNLDPSTVVHPAESHPSVILHAIAASDVPTAERLQTRYHFAKAYGSYRGLLSDGDIDAVYIHAPIALRFGFAEQVLNHGKHVLCVSPLAANADDVRRLVELAKDKGLILEEGASWQFHPAIHAYRKIVDARELGRILRTEAVVTCTLQIPMQDKRWDFNMGGGSAIALTSAIAATRFSLHATTPSTLLSVTARPSQSDPRVDAALHTHMTFENPPNHAVISKVHTDMSRPWAGGLLPRVWEVPTIEVETEKAQISFYNFTHPHLYHLISVTDKTTGATTYKKQYTGGPLWGKVVVSTGEKGGNSGWSTHRWQLEAFVDAVQGRTPAYWVAGKESVWLMESVDAVYRAAGLPLRESLREEIKDG
ncbi:hypothetical protein NUU61_000280 [Penicillium alfredii]|uniref:D-xylose 1-dehydrogenase (NADP(+), D-xylono-1,5-lactone-forming) n=1 Tax=Penicillium alfredii TaxID=1506179 RepID=A0A9W9G9C9_9EURO|nr:uncharacterized protein NUU61_000280 [Penicillium alfredii]KAJ5114521.1 hypothetical protein NUU61_000280 [Penicillium alfredii]